ncbi:uncharacterized protein JCM15063_000646 [Sporobolomyces koalae]|uniref:uncharacterized protein n=1 Tax=Sporobolomyces koalae TaxID=500713 RepID=UPI00318172B2
MVVAADRSKSASSPTSRRSAMTATAKAPEGTDGAKPAKTARAGGRSSIGAGAKAASRVASPARGGMAVSEGLPIRPAAQQPHRLPKLASHPPLDLSTLGSAQSPLPLIPPLPMTGTSSSIATSSPASTSANPSKVEETVTSIPAVAPKPAGPLPRIPVFPLVDSYVPDPKSSDKRHPRQLVPADLGFPTPDMTGKIRKEDLDDRLLMATCAVMHCHENRALCPKEVAEVMLEKGWLKNAGTSPFAHVSTCIRAHIARVSSASPTYLPLLIPFELVGALTAEEVRAVGLHAEQRPAVKRGTLWYLNPQVFGPGIGADDPFVRCRKEAGLAGSDRDGLYVRGLVPLQTGHSSVPAPGLRLSSNLYISNGADDDGDEEGMGRGKRKRRASSAMMAAMSTTEPNANSAHATVPPASNAAPTPIAIPPANPAIAPSNPAPPRRNAAFGASSAPVRSSLPKLKLRLTALEEVESDVADSDGHVGEAACRRKKNKKKVRRAGSEGVSRAGSVEPSLLPELSESLPGISRSRASTFSATSSAALLAQSLLAASASSPSFSPNDLSAAMLEPTNPVISPDELSLANAPINLVVSRPPSVPVTPALHLSISAPNTFSHHFAIAASPVEPMDQDASSEIAKSMPAPGNAQEAVASPSRSDSADEEDFHEAMLRADEFDFEWGADSCTTGSSSVISTHNGKDISERQLEPNVELSLPLLPSSAPDAVNASTAGEDSIGTDDLAIDTPATTPRNPDELEAEPVEEKSTTPEMKRENPEKDEGPLGKISRVGMQATLCGALEAQDDRDDDVVIVKAVDRKQEGSATLDSFAQDTPARRRQLSVARGHSELAGLAAPLPSPLALDLPPMLPLAHNFTVNEFDFVGIDESDFLHSPSDDHADSADDEDEQEEEGDDERDDLVTIEHDHSDYRFAMMSHPSSRGSSVYPLDGFDRELLLRATSTGASSHSSEGSEAYDQHQVVSSSLLATGLPVPQQAPSPPDATEWSMNLDVDELDGELGTHVDLLAPESIGLEELDLAWAAEDDDDERDVDLHDGSYDSAKNHSAAFAQVPSSASTAFLTGSSTPRFTTALPSPLTRRPSLMGDLGKGKATVAQQLDSEESLAMLPARRTSGRKTNNANKSSPHRSLDAPVADEEPEEPSEDEGRAEFSLDEETENPDPVRKSGRITRASVSSASRKSPRRLSTARH